jgi:hypothetical protein
MTAGLQKRAGVMEYWSGGVMNQNQTETHQPRFRANRGMIICPLQAIMQKQIQGGVPIILATLKCPEVHYPLLPYSNTPLLAPGA